MFFYNHAIQQAWLFFLGINLILNSNQNCVVNIETTPWR
jgi:hypothetical protein